MSSYNVKIIRYTESKKFVEVTKIESFKIDAKDLKKLRKFLKSLK